MIAGDCSGCDVDVRVRGLMMPFWVMKTDCVCVLDTHVVKCIAYYYVYTMFAVPGFVVVVNASMHGS